MSKDNIVSLVSDSVPKERIVTYTVRYYGPDNEVLTAVNDGFVVIAGDIVGVQTSEREPLFAIPITRLIDMTTEITEKETDNGDSENNTVH